MYWMTVDNIPLHFRQRSLSRESTRAFVYSQLQILCCTASNYFRSRHTFSGTNPISSIALLPLLLISAHFNIEYIRNQAIKRILQECTQFLFYALLMRYALVLVFCCYFEWQECVALVRPYLIIVIIIMHSTWRKSQESSEWNRLIIYPSAATAAVVVVTCIGVTHVLLISSLFPFLLHFITIWHPCQHLPITSMVAYQCGLLESCNRWNIATSLAIAIMPMVQDFFLQTKVSVCNVCMGKFK